MISNNNIWLQTRHSLSIIIKKTTHKGRNYDMAVRPGPLKSDDLRRMVLPKVVSLYVVPSQVKTTGSKGDLNNSKEKLLVIQDFYSQNFPMLWFPNVDYTGPQNFSQKYPLFGFWLISNYFWVADSEVRFWLSGQNFAVFPVLIFWAPKSNFRNFGNFFEN